MKMSQLIVEIPQGKLQGKENKSVLNQKPYYSFLGIPYAKPPLGDLRFKPPEPSENWEGVYDATFERDVCKQSQDLGSENCLFLNIDTPKDPSEARIPAAVMVFIHGGSFARGSGSQDMYSPDYLLDHDVILVRLNYRLHVLGFLNLGLPDCPGNAGLKDQTLAMKWVKINISHFGGDPNNITVFGISSGASSVHYHVSSPLSKGLFNKAIIQGGSTLSAWATTSDPKGVAKRLAKRLGFEGGSDTNLLKFLKKQDAEDLTQHVMDMFREQKGKTPGKGLHHPFSPSVEEIKEGAFLPDSPHALLKSSDPLPIIYGLNDKEGLMAFYLHQNDIWDVLRNDFSAVLRNNFKVHPALLPEISSRVKEYYFGGKEIGPDTADQMINLFSDLYFYQLYEPIDFVTDSSIPPFVYEFTYSGEFNFCKHMISKFVKLDKGACHADEQGYLFYAPKMLPNPSLRGDDLTVIQNLTKLWTNFAKTGIPSDKKTWAPSTTNQPCYLKIDRSLRLMDGKVYGERLQFLRDLLEPVAEPYNLMCKL